MNSKYTSSRQKFKMSTQYKCSKGISHIKNIVSNNSHNGGVGEQPQLQN